MSKHSSISKSLLLVVRTQFFKMRGLSLLSWIEAVIIGFVAFRQISKILDGDGLSNWMTAALIAMVFLLLTEFCLTFLTIYKRGMFEEEFLKNFSMSFGAGTPRRAIEERRFRILWKPIFSKIPKTLLLAGTAQQVTLRDLISLQKWLNAKVTEANSQEHYLIDFKKFSNGVLHAELVFDDEKEVVSQWSLFLLNTIKNEVTALFKNFDSIEIDPLKRIMSFDPGEILSSRRLSEFEKTFEKESSLSVSVSQDDGTVVLVKVVDKSKKEKRKAVTERLNRLWAHAAKENHLYTLRLSSVEVQNKSTICFVFDSNESSIREEDFLKLQETLRRDLSKSFGDDWEIQNRILENGRILARRVTSE